MGRDFIINWLLYRIWEWRGQWRRFRFESKDIKPFSIHFFQLLLLLLYGIKTEADLFSSSSFTQPHWCVWFRRHTRVCVYILCSKANAKKKSETRKSIENQNVIRIQRENQFWGHCSIDCSPYLKNGFICFCSFVELQSNYSEAKMMMTMLSNAYTQKQPTNKKYTKIRAYFCNGNGCASETFLWRSNNTPTK